MAYQMIAITKAFSREEKEKWLKDSEKRLREKASYQLGFGYDAKGDVRLTIPLQECYFFGIPDNKRKIVQTKEEMFRYERGSLFQKLWHRLFPSTEVGIYVKV